MTLDSPIKELEILANEDFLLRTVLECVHAEPDKELDILRLALIQYSKHFKRMESLLLAASMLSE